MKYFQIQNLKSAPLQIHSQNYTLLESLSLIFVAKTQTTVCFSRLLVAVLAQQMLHPKIYLKLMFHDSETNYSKIAMLTRCTRTSHAFLLTKLKRTRRTYDPKTRSNFWMDKLQHIFYFPIIYDRPVFYGWMSF